MEFLSKFLGPSTAEPVYYIENDDHSSSKISTLPLLFTKIVPKAQIKAPNVIVVGAQSSGKTKMVTNLIFYYLRNVASFTDTMGDSILKVFRTGDSMTTRRPIVVKLNHNSDNANLCQIDIKFRGRAANFHGDSLLFDELLQAATATLDTEEEKTISDEAFELSITAKGLPSVEFTDLPGIPPAMDHRGRSCRDLVSQYALDPNSVLVVLVRAEECFGKDFHERSLIISFLQ